jgi:hypothetical protein
MVGQGAGRDEGQSRNARRSHTARVMKQVSHLRPTPAPSNSNGSRAPTCIKKEGECESGREGGRMSRCGNLVIGHNDSISALGFRAASAAGSCSPVAYGDGGLAGSRRGQRRGQRRDSRGAVIVFSRPIASQGLGGTGVDVGRLKSLDSPKPRSYRLRFSFFLSSSFFFFFFFFSCAESNDVRRPSINSLILGKYVDSQYEGRSNGESVASALWYWLK